MEHMYFPSWGWEPGIPKSGWQALWEVEMALTIYTNSSPQKSLLELNIFVSLRFELKSHFKIEKTFV